MVYWAEVQGYSLMYLIYNPGRLVTLFYNTLLWQGAYLHQTMIGSALGNLDAGLGAPYLVMMILTGCLILLALKKPGETLMKALCQISRPPLSRARGEAHVSFDREFSF